MDKYLTLKPISYVNGEVYLPGSKSISNRVLMISALSCGITSIENLLYSDDTQYMLLALKKIGIQYHLSNNNKNCIINGNKNDFLNIKIKSLFLGNAGTAVRPLIAILSLQCKEIIINGDDRMQERPIKDLVDAIQQGNGVIEYIKNKNYLPIKIKGGFQGGNIIVKSNISSQFLTALLIAAPLAKLDTNIIIQGKLVSKPYIDMTIKIMKNFGIKIDHKNYSSFHIPGNQTYYSPGKYHIEGDASSASYFLAAAAIKGKSIKVIGINKNSIQGDIKFIEVIKKMGAKIYFKNHYIECKKGNLIGIDIDANDIPDAAMTIAIMALFSKNSTIIRNIYNWRVKETDRLYAMSCELRKIGAEVKEGKDFIHITPPKYFLPAKINTYNDHRIAMCFSLIALSNQTVTIINPHCVSKTFPNYFQELNKISVFNNK